VMPGHIGTSIVQNSIEFGKRELTEDEREVAVVAAQMFHDNAPMTAAEAATVILNDVLAERWRILVGDDAYALDRAVRAAPEEAYDGSMSEILFADLNAARAALDQ